MPGFEDAWAAVAASRDCEAVSPELKPLLRDVYSSILSSPPDLIELQKGLEQLLGFLAGPGRTNANCWATDLFFMLCKGWERDWTEQELPEGFHDVLSLMGDALHDTVQSPKFASDYGCLPEQLLERVRKLRIDDVHA